MSQLSATQGCMLKCSSRCTRESKISWSILSDCASVPTRGSRFDGLNSMTITSVFDAGRLEHEILPAHKKKNKNHRGHGGTRRTSASKEKHLCVPLCPLWLEIWV